MGILFYLLECEITQALNNINFEFENSKFNNSGNEEHEKMYTYDYKKQTENVVRNYLRL